MQLHTSSWTAGTVVRDLRGDGGVRGWGEVGGGRGDPAAAPASPNPQAKERVSPLSSISRRFLLPGRLTAHRGRVNLRNLPPLIRSGGNQHNAALLRDKRRRGRKRRRRRVCSAVTDTKRRSEVARLRVGAAFFRACQRRLPAGRGSAQLHITTSKDPASTCSCKHASSAGPQPPCEAATLLAG